MAYKNYVLPVPRTSVAGGDFSGSYQPINPDGLPHGCCYVRIVNNSDSDISISYDGTTDHDFVAKSTSNPLNFQANAQPTSQMLNLRGGTIVYMSGTMSSSGAVYLIGYYQPA